MKPDQGFAIWITGLPSSGKSSITRELVNQLRTTGVLIVVLESDQIRKILTPEPSYSTEERNLFYRNLMLLGQVLVRQGVNVIFDATANKRAYRDNARSAIPKFVEVYVSCPLEICRQRDAKGLYADAASGKTRTAPGVQEPYEPPHSAEVIVDGQQPAAKSAESIMLILKTLRFI